MFMFFQQFFTKDKEIKQPMYKWLVEPVDVIFAYHGVDEGIVRAGERNGIVLHKDGLVKIAVVNGINHKLGIVKPMDKKDIRYLTVTVESLIENGYITKYSLLSK